MEPWLLPALLFGGPGWLVALWLAIRLDTERRAVREATEALCDMAQRRTG